MMMVINYYHDDADGQDYDDFADGHDYAYGDDDDDDNYFAFCVELPDLVVVAPF